MRQLRSGQKLKEAAREMKVVICPGVYHVFAAFDDLEEV